MKKYLLILPLLLALASSSRAQERVVVSLEDDHLSMDDNGDRWKTYELDSLYIFMNVRKVRGHGKYYLIDLYLQNNSAREQGFSFQDASVSTFRRTNPFIPEKKYLRRMRRGRFWSTFGLMSAAVTTSVVTQAFIEDAFPDPVDRSLGQDILHDVVSVAAQGLISVGTAAILGNFEEDYAKSVRHNVGYLRDYNLAPDNAVRGHVFARQIKNAKDIMVNIPIGPHVYAFKWTSDQIKDK